ncbi:MAG: DUF2786 domain-containing protein [Deltaproteobacteria bacterium]|jgi:hypothetical protein|nr:DUF2786 domain-containing protein [Deltaproteobacteria bacterium]
MDFNQRSEELKHKFRSNWVRELTRNYQWEISKLNLNKTNVLIDVFENNTQWGYWNPQTRVIGINSKLILDYPWDVALGILHHEIAHQVVTDVYPLAAVEEKPHGPMFQSVCERMRIHPMYRQASVDVSGDGPPPCKFGPKSQTLEENPLLAKIKKLLALSGSPEPHEAEAALTKASMLMAKHNIDTSAFLAESDDYEIWRFHLKTKKICRKSFLISLIVSNHFFVRSLSSTVYDPMTCEYTKAIDFIGRPVNLSMAKHVYEYLNERSETLWEKHKPMAALNGEKGLGAKTAFITNLLASLDKKLTQAEEERKNAMADQAQSSNGEKYVIPYDFVRNDMKLDAFIQLNYRSLRNSSKKSDCAYAPYSSSAGKIAGENLNIYSPISEGQHRDGTVKGYLGKD